MDRPLIDDPHDDLPARVEAAAAMNRLAHALVGHRADPAVLRRLAAAADRLAAEVEAQPRRFRGTELSDSPQMAEVVEEPTRLRDAVVDGAFIDVFHDSPVSGAANPLSVGLRIHADGNEAVGVVALRHGWEGAPGRGHGGIIAACIDETFGGLLPLLGEIAFTGELSIRYEAPCPVGVELEFRARLLGHEGRKLHLECTGTAGATRFVRATALFITVDLDHFRALTSG
jgi:hypothetical protein